MANSRRKRGSQQRAKPKSGASHPPRAERVQIGRRPSSPPFLVFVGVMWVGVGVIIQLTMSWSWRLVPAIVAAGIGLLFLRGGLRTVLRHEERQS